MEKEISCLTHKEFFSSYSLDGPNPIVAYPVFIQNTPPNIEHDHLVIKAQPQSFDASVVIKEIAIPSVHPLIPEIKTSPLSGSPGNIQLRTWIDKLGMIKHIHLDIPPFLDFGDPRSLAKFMRSLKTSSPDALYEELKYGFPACHLSSDVGVLYTVGESEIFSLTHNGYEFHKKIKKLKALDTHGHWEDHGLYRSNLSQSPYFFEVLAGKFSAQVLSKPIKRNILKPKTFFQKEQPNLLEGRIIAGLLIQDLNFATLNLRLKTMIEKGEVYSNSLRELINPYFKIEWNESKVNLSQKREPKN